MSRTTYVRASVVMALCFGLCATAYAGTAYYGGFDDPPAETGVPYWDGTPTGPILEAMNPGWKIGVEESTEIGSFTLNDGTTPLTIPAASDFVLMAEWDLPEPNAIPGRDCYFYIGIDPNDIDTWKLRLGIEWKGDPKHWVIRMQNLAVDVDAPAGTTRLGVKFQRAAGDPLLYHWYRVNGGAWQPYANAYWPGSVDLSNPALGGADTQPLYVTWKVRGLGGIIDPTITGAGVPDVNTGNDHDGDTVDDENDPWPGNGDWATDNDADGLADEWEMANFSDLDEIASGNPDDDSFTNIEEMNNGTDPNVYDDVPTMTYVGVLVLLALIVIVAGWTVFRRARA